MSQTQAKAEFIKIPETPGQQQTLPTDPSNRVPDDEIRIDFCTPDDAELIVRIPLPFPFQLHLSHFTPTHVTFLTPSPGRRQLPNLLFRLFRPRRTPRPPPQPTSPHPTPSKTHPALALRARQHQMAQSDPRAHRRCHGHRMLDDTFRAVPLALAPRRHRPRGL